MNLGDVPHPVQYTYPMWRVRALAVAALIAAACVVAIVAAIACNAVVWSYWPEPDKPLLNGCLAEGVTSDYTGRVEGYVLVTFPDLETNAHRQFLLPERRARELQNKLANALVNVKQLLEDEE